MVLKGVWRDQEGAVVISCAEKVLVNGPTTKEKPPRPRMIVMLLLAALWATCASIGTVSPAGAEDGGATFQPLAPDADATGKGCSFFTRPPVERSENLGVRSVRLNYYENGARVCHGTSRYECVQNRWVKVSPDCTKDDRQQAWRLEGTDAVEDGASGSEPDQQGPPDEGAGFDKDNPGGGPESPYATRSPYGGASGM